jgi:hypothetical protein
MISLPSIQGRTVVLACPRLVQARLWRVWPCGNWSELNQSIRNRQVIGSIPIVGSRLYFLRLRYLGNGYARVSTDDQTLDLQRDALKRAKCRQICEEHASGKTTSRPELDACLKSLRKGDTLVVWRLDRLGRSLGALIHLKTDFRCRDVD